MDLPPDSLAVNQAHWDERAPADAASPAYAIDRFRVDPEFLSEVVRFDLPRLGDISGLRGGLDGGRRTCGAGNEAGVDLGSAGS